MARTTDWTSGWLRSQLELAVTAVLVSGPLHGYAIAAELEQRGLGTVRGGTLYPVLARLEQDGVLAARWEAGTAGPGRKVFEMTDVGRARLEEHRQHWRDYAAAMTALLHDTATETR